MQRRKFGREFKIEAVRLIKERGVAVAQASRDLDVHENVLRKWVKELSADPCSASNKVRIASQPDCRDLSSSLSRYRSGTGVSGRWPDEARSARDRSPAS